MTTRRGGIPATQLIAEKERRLQEDPEYRAQWEEAESERAERVRRKRDAEQPVLQELAAHGIETDSLWNLYKTPDVQAAAAPILIQHLQQDHPDSIYDALAAALDPKASRSWWHELAGLYTSTHNDHLRDRLASLLSQCATRAQYDDLLAFVEAETLGTSRIYFLRPIQRIGNRIRPGAGREIVAGFVGDPVVGKEAAAIVAGKGPNA